MTSLPNPSTAPFVTANARVVTDPLAPRLNLRRAAAGVLRWTAIWLAVSLVFVSQNTLRFVMRGQGVDWFGALWLELLYWVPWLALTPALLATARRWPLGSGAPAVNVWRHLAAMVAVSFIQVIAADALQYAAGVAHGVLTAPDRAQRAVTAYSRSFPALAITAWWKYWVFMGLYFAFDYHRRFREREVAAAQLEAQLVTAQLQTLRAQLHPHFLFNALHSAAMLTMIDPERAHRVLVQLSALLRTTLDRSSANEVSLADELDFVDRYLAIERIRFQDRLQVDIQADDDALAASVPNLILQPLVENAVRHGIARRAGARRLAIRTFRRESTLVLEVEDDGPGLPSGWTLTPTSEGGVGLANVRARLERMYGAQGRLELASPVAHDGRPGAGVVARVAIPYRRAASLRGRGLIAIDHDGNAPAATTQVAG